MGRRHGGNGAPVQPEIAPPSAQIAAQVRRSPPEPPTRRKSGKSVGIRPKRWRGPTLGRNERWPRVSTDKNVQHARVLRIDGFLVKPPGIKVFERKIRRILSDRIRQALGIDSEKD